MVHVIVGGVHYESMIEPSERWTSVRPCQRMFRHASEQRSNNSHTNNDENTFNVFDHLDGGSSASVWTGLFDGYIFPGSTVVGMTHRGFLMGSNTGRADCGGHTSQDPAAEAVQRLALSFNALYPGQGLTLSTSLLTLSTFCGQVLSLVPSYRLRLTPNSSRKKVLTLS